MHFIKWLKIEIIHQYYRTFKFPKVLKIGKKYNVYNVEDTIKSLIKYNKSLCRFGDGELGWLYGKNVLPYNMAFEHSSKDLKNKLRQVLNTTSNNIEIGLISLRDLKGLQYKNNIRRSSKLFISELGHKWMKYLHCNVQYVNTNSTRIFSWYNNYSYIRYLFILWKKVWCNKNILIIEGRGTRFGVHDNFINNTNKIYRIECPIQNAFESYNIILNKSLNFTISHNIDIVLVSLGPTATILCYSLSKNGVRALDVGHIDVEYEWFLRKKVCNIPYKFVNEVQNGWNVIPIHDKNYNKEIVINID